MAWTENASSEADCECCMAISENATMEKGEAVGIAIAKEMMSYTESFVDGYYFYSLLTEFIC